MATLFKQEDPTLSLLRERRKSVQLLILQYRQLLDVAKRLKKSREISGPEKRNRRVLADEISKCGSGCDCRIAIVEIRLN